MKSIVTFSFFFLFFFLFTRIQIRRVTFNRTYINTYTIFGFSDFRLNPLIEIQFWQKSNKSQNFCRYSVYNKSCSFCFVSLFSLTHSPSLYPVCSLFRWKFVGSEIRFWKLKQRVKISKTLKKKRLKMVRSFIGVYVQTVSRRLYNWYDFYSVRIQQEWKSVTNVVLKAIILFASCLHSYILSAIQTIASTIHHSGWIECVYEWEEERESRREQERERK